MAILLPDRIAVATFGEFLRDARERRGLTLQQIARETRIPWRHLDALEHGNLNVVPGGMYRRAEIRAYADAVGLDRSLALAQLEHALESSVAPEVRTPSAQPPESRARTTWPALGAIGVVAAATMFAVSLWNERSAPAPAADAPTVSTVQATPADAPAVAVPPTAPLPVVDAPATLAVAQPEPAAVASVSTAMTITSDPPGARVMVDGIGRGATPVTVHNLTSGGRRVRVIKNGFVSQERVVGLGTDGKPTTVHVTLSAVH